MSKSADLVMELRTKKIEDLIKLGEDRRAELFALKFQAAVGSLEQTHKIKSLKKDIARIELLLGERKRSGEEVDKIVVKPDYSKAVENAEKAGKEVRKKQREMLEKMQQEQFGNANQAQVSEDAILAAMNAAVDESEVKETKTTKAPAKKAEAKVEAKPKAVKEVAAKETKPKAAKEATTKSTAAKETKTTKAPSTKAEAKPATTKSTAAKPAKKQVEEVEVKAVLTKESAKKTGKASSKVIEDHSSIDVSEAKATGKGKAALKDVKPKTVKVGTVKAENVEGIDLKLSAKPKNAKTYTFGSNAQEAKKQLDEANKKLASKKIKTVEVDETTAKKTTAKKTSTKKGEN
ncbi:50S ribosomal protein L29 [Spiroplasma litorale]|uniref:Large ribosomal subunit protein uL29 n=1 Tax=Spiroplasma litorale TaxID=216942 RepID=A0A0K1W2Q0_9MOLU|nr:50S ribosomal protein L29 [Spiroplasma litorale]AKX34605.1 50S ribosomal protein L29 [Spiroplasma litorale]